MVHIEHNIGIYMYIHLFNGRVDIVCNTGIIL